MKACVGLGIPKDILLPECPTCRPFEIGISIQGSFGIWGFKGMVPNKFYNVNFSALDKCFSQNVR